MFTSDSQACDSAITYSGIFVGSLVGFCKPWRKASKNEMNTAGNESGYESADIVTRSRMPKSSERQGSLNVRAKPRLSNVPKLASSHATTDRTVSPTIQ